MIEQDLSAPEPNPQDDESKLDVGSTQPAAEGSAGVDPLLDPERTVVGGPPPSPDVVNSNWRGVYYDGDRHVSASEVARGAAGESTCYGTSPDGMHGGIDSTIHFQPAPIPQVGVIAWTNEALLAVVIDRLASFQMSKFPDPLNDLASRSIQVALSALELRTKQRTVRGVEGTMTP